MTVERNPAVERKLDPDEITVAELELDCVRPPSFDWYYAWIAPEAFVGGFYSIDDRKLTRFSAADWQRWLHDEIEEYENERDITGMLDSWLDDPEKEPVVVTLEDDYLRIWDGHHRIAGSIEYGMESIPAYVGVPR